MKKVLPFLIAVLSVAVFSLLKFTSIDYKVADLFQRVLPPLKEQSNVIMINVDDDSIDNIGTFPFSRDVYATMLLTLRELDTEAVVFDLSFLDKSAAKVDEKYIKESLPKYNDDYFNTINEQFISIMDAYSSGALNASDAANAKAQLLDLTSRVKDELNTSISYVIRSQDENLANALKFFDNAYLTLTFDGSSAPGPDVKLYLEQKVALKVLSDDDHITPTLYGVMPAIRDFIFKSRKAGFVNADPDRDGFLRHIHPVMKYNGNYFGQLLFTPVLNHFGNPLVEVTDRYVILHNAKISESESKDIKIPRSENGSIIVKYPPKKYVDYNSISLWNIYRISLLEENLIDLVRQMDDNGFFSYSDDSSPVEYFDGAEYIKNELFNGEDPSNGITYEAYLEYRTGFFNSLTQCLSDDYRQILLDDVDGDEEMVDFINSTFETVKKSYEEYMEDREDVTKKVSDAICIVGTCATSTSDYGNIQYEEHYPNPGVHYVVANQILTQDFVDDAPVWVTIVIALVVCLAYCCIAQTIKGTGHQLLFGIIAIFVCLCGLLGVFVATKVYVGAVVPAISLFACFVATTVIGFLAASKDKKFITNAFSQCLSPDVVQELIDDPSSFKLGGDNRIMSAIFTDIQKFSGFSELLTADELVALLNYYLTAMSDIIMEERGLVDKYEGDAIVALVGAPKTMEDHASRAVSAAIKMKKHEISMNRDIVSFAAKDYDGTIPENLYSAFCKLVKGNRTIYTRIGINSGDMVAGYMGSEGKKNYTMMGNNVNLASRLEGVNKVFRTYGILISDATRSFLGSEFVVRKLSRVQVVNVEKPIRLYEPMEKLSDADDKLIKYVDNWDTTMKVFERGDYEKALVMFKKLHEARPSDKVAEFYIELIEKFFGKGKYPVEADDVGVEYNPANSQDFATRHPDWVGTEFEVKGTFRLCQK